MPSVHAPVDSWRRIPCGLDALHLAAALVVTEDRPVAIEFVAFDEHLAEAADKEGFSILSA